jgi:hypothetical protein
MRKIVITGGARFLGQRLARGLLRSNLNLKGDELCWSIFGLRARYGRRKLRGSCSRLWTCSSQRRGSQLEAMSRRPAESRRTRTWVARGANGCPTAKDPPLAHKPAPARTRSGRSRG